MLCGAVGVDGSGGVIASAGRFEFETLGVLGRAGIVNDAFFGKSVHPRPLVQLQVHQLVRTVNWVSTNSQQGLFRMDVNALLDNVKKSRSLAFDKDLADLLSVDKAAVSNWRKAKNLPGIEACARLADLSGLPVHRVVGVIEEARAHARAVHGIERLSGCG